MALDRRIRRDLRSMGIGHLQVTSKATTSRALSKDITVVDKLIEDRQVGVLHALFDRRVSLAQLVDADRRHQLQGQSILSDIALNAPLWPAMTAALSTMGRSTSTRNRYGVSCRALQRSAGEWLDDSATVQQLSLVEWRALSSRWANSAADWNHIRRFVSAFLTHHLRDKYHPFRRSVVGTIPLQPEAERISQLTPEVFGRIFHASPDYLKPVWITLLVTGMRVRSEYLRCTRAHLKPAIHAVDVPGTKTHTSHGTVFVEPELWPWIESAIPSPRQYKALRDALVGLRTVARVDDLRLHDFRHALGQWAIDGGVDITKVKEILRHTTLAMTARYTRQAAKGEVARAMGAALKSRIG